MTRRKKPKRKKKPHVYKLRTDNGLKVRIDDGVNLSFKGWDKLPKMTDTIEFKVLIERRDEAVVVVEEAPTCRTCGTDRFVAKGDEYRTCVGYHSPPGHDHDDNCFATPFKCANGHWRNYSLRRKCPACDWTSRASCSIEDHGPAFFRMPEIEASKDTL